jgi:hypothetical protein
MAVRAVLVAGLVLLLAAVLVTMASSAPRQAGSNYVPDTEEVVNRHGPWRHCQDGELVPKDAARLRLRVGTYGRPTPAVRITARGPGGDLVTAGGVAAGGREGDVYVPVRRVQRTRQGVRVCVSVSGRRRAVLYGAAGRLRLDWYRPGEETWFEILPTIAHRFSLARANPIGPALLPLAAVILLGCWLAATRIVVRELGE